VKYGHTEPHLPGSNPATWKWKVRETVWEQPEIVVLVGAGAVALICLGAALYVVMAHWERRHPPQ